MKLVHVLIYAGMCYFAEGLRQVQLRLGPVSNSAIVTLERLDNEDTDNGTPASAEKSPLMQTIVTNDASVSFIQEIPSSSDVDTTFAPKRLKKKKRKTKRGKKKNMRKVKVHPRGGRHIKDTYQDLHSVQYVVGERPLLEGTTETVVTLEPIYDKSENNSYTQEELLKLCEETKKIGEKFGIHDISSFAGRNCALIRLYYPDVTCEQINVFLQYCRNALSGL